MKKIILGAMIAAVAIFTACGDDDSVSSSGESGSVTSCDITVSMGDLGRYHMCMESSSKNALDKECKEVSGEEVEDEITYSYEGKIGSGCEGSAKKKCNIERNHIPLTAYFYDAAMASKSCDQLMNYFLE